LIVVDSADGNGSVEIRGYEDVRDLPSLAVAYACLCMGQVMVNEKKKERRFSVGGEDQEKVHPTLAPEFA